MSFRPPSTRRVPQDAYDYIVWSMDESASPVSNIGNGPPLDISGSGSFLSTGIFGTSVGFSTQGLTSGDSTVEPNALSFTYSAWVWLRTYSTGSPQIVDKSWNTTGTGWGPPFGIGIILDSTNDGAWVVGGGPTGAVSISSADPVPLHQWVHLAFTWDGFDLKAYKNGTLSGVNNINAGPGAVAFDFGNHGPWQIGANVMNVSDYIDGYIDDIRISNIARTAEYINLQYRWGIGQFDDRAPDPFTFFGDFTFLPLGKITNADFISATGLNFARASAATVQTSASILDSTPTTDQPRIGSLGEAWGRGLVLEESRTNNHPQARSMTGASTSGSPTITEAFTAGPDGNVNASRVQLASGGYVDLPSTYTTGSNVFTAWVRATSGTTAAQILAGMLPASDYAIGNLSIGTKWQKFQVTGTSASTGTGDAITPDTRDKTANGGITAASTDSCWDFKQVEAGKFETEVIVTSGSPVTRAGERLFITDAGQCIDANTLNLYYKLIPKGSSSDYSSNMRLWTIDTDNYAELDHTTNILRVSVQAALWETAIPVTWNKGDVLEIFVTVGGGVPGVAVYRRNGGNPIQLGSSDNNIASVPNNGALDVLCNGTSNQFSSWVKFISFWKAGHRPHWAVTPPPFLPTSISGLHLWLVSSLGVTEAGVVSNWADQSGDANDFAQPDGPSQPTFESTGINNKPDMQYLGAQTLYGATGMNIQHAITVFAIFREVTPVGSTQVIFGKGFTQSAWQIDTNPSGYANFSTAGGASGVSDFTLLDGNPHVVVGVFDNVSTEVRQYVDGVKQLNSGTTIFDILTLAYPASVGSATDDGITLHFPLTGYVAEVGVYGKALLTGELTLLNNYLLTKAGITQQFRPDAFSGLQMWFRYDHQLSLSGNQVTNWGDLSGHSRDLIQPSSGNQPLTSLDVNSNLIGVAFNGSNSYMYWDVTDVATTAIVAFGIFRTTNIINSGQLWGKGLSSTQWFFAGHTVGMGGTIDFAVGGANIARGDVNLNDGLAHTIVGTWDSTSHMVSLYVDGFLQYQTSTFSGTISGGDRIGVGAETNTSSALAFYEGDLVEVGVYNRSLDGGSISSLNTYLSKRAPNMSRSPKEIPGLNSWFRSTLNVTQAGTVSSWDDLSGAGVLPTLAQPTGGLQPAYNTTSSINNIPEMLGTGAEALVGNTTLLGTTALSLFLIFQTSGSGNYGLWGKSFSSNSYKIAMSFNSIHAYINSSGANSGSDTTLNDGLPHIVVVTWDNTDGEIRLYIDGLLQSSLSVENGTLSTTGDANSVLAMAQDPATITDQFVGSIPEVGSYGRRLTPKEAVALSHYLSYRAGITIVEYPYAIATAGLVIRPDSEVILGGNLINSITGIISLTFNSDVIELVQSDVTKKPVLIDPGMNSFADISFDGTTSLYSTNVGIATTDPTKLTMYIVFSTTDASPFVTMAGMHGSNAHYSFDLANGILQANINGQMTTSDVTVNDGNIHWAVMLWDAADTGGSIDLYINGSPQTSSVGSTTTPISDGTIDGDQHSMGAGVTNLGATITNNFTGHIADHGSYSSKLTGTDRNHFFSYLHTRSGR